MVTRRQCLCVCAVLFTQYGQASAARPVSVDGCRRVHVEQAQGTTDCVITDSDDVTTSRHEDHLYAGIPL